MAIHAILETNIYSAEVYYFAFRDIERHLPAACPLIECIDVSLQFHGICRILDCADNLSIVGELED